MNTLAEKFSTNHSRFFSPLLFVVALSVMVCQPISRTVASMTDDEIPGRNNSPLQDLTGQVDRQRKWIEARLRQLQAEQENLRSLLDRLNAGETIHLPTERVPFRGITSDDQLLPRSPLESVTDSGQPTTSRPPIAWSQMSAEQRQEIYNFAISFDPKVKTKLEELREKNPQQYEKIMSQNGPRLVEMMQMKARDPDMYELKRHDALLTRRSAQLAASIRKLRDNPESSPEDLQLADQQEKELEAILREHFDVRQRIREYELDMIALRLRDLEEELSLRNQHREELVSDRITELLYESDRKVKDKTGK